MNARKSRRQGCFRVRCGRWRTWTKRRRTNRADSLRTPEADGCPRISNLAGCCLTRPWRRDWHGGARIRRGSSRGGREPSERHRGPSKRSLRDAKRSGVSKRGSAGRTTETLAATEALGVRGPSRGNSVSVHPAATGLQKRWIGTKPPDRHLPHPSRMGLEHDVAVGLGCQPL